MRIIIEHLSSVDFGQWDFRLDRFGFVTEHHIGCDGDRRENTDDGHGYHDLVKSKPALVRIGPRHYSLPHSFPGAPTVELNGSSIASSVDGQIIRLLLEGLPTLRHCLDNLTAMVPMGIDVHPLFPIADGVHRSAF